jgi:hypothetical protein
VTTLRSAAGAAADGGLSGVGVAASAVPHSPQNFTPGAFAQPQASQVRASGEPHSPQNFLPASFSVPHAGQSTD